MVITPEAWYREAMAELEVSRAIAEFERAPSWENWQQVTRTHERSGKDVDPFQFFGGNTRTIRRVFENIVVEKLEKELPGWDVRGWKGRFPGGVWLTRKFRFFALQSVFRLVYDLLKPRNEIKLSYSDGMGSDYRPGPNPYRGRYETPFKIRQEYALSDVVGHLREWEEKTEKLDQEASQS